jgi:hypothetical protein
MATNSAPKSFDQSEGSGLKKQEALDDMLWRLGIDKDEIDDLIFEDVRRRRQRKESSGQL